MELYFDGWIPVDAFYSNICKLHTSEFIACRNNESIVLRINLEIACIEIRKIEDESQGEFFNLTPTYTYA